MGGGLWFDEGIELVIFVKKIKNSVKFYEEI